MSAKQEKKSRQVKRAEARKAEKEITAPVAQIPTLTIELALPEVELIVQGLLELPGKYTLQLMDKLGRAKQAVLEVKPEGKKK